MQALLPIFVKSSPSSHLEYEVPVPASHLESLKQQTGPLTLL